MSTTVLIIKSELIWLYIVGMFHINSYRDLIFVYFVLLHSVCVGPKHKLKPSPLSPALRHCSYNFIDSFFVFSFSWWSLRQFVLCVNNNSDIWPKEQGQSLQIVEANYLNIRILVEGNATRRLRRVNFSSCLMTFLNKRSCSEVDGAWVIRKHS